MFGLWLTSRKGLSKLTNRYSSWRLDTRGVEDGLIAFPGVSEKVHFSFASVSIS